MADITNPSRSKPYFDWGLGWIAANQIILLVGLLVAWVAAIPFGLFGGNMLHLILSGLPPGAPILDLGFAFGTVGYGIVVSWLYGRTQSLFLNRRLWSWASVIGGVLFGGAAALILIAARPEGLFRPSPIHSALDYSQPTLIQASPPSVIVNVLFAAAFYFCVGAVQSRTLPKEYRFVWLWRSFLGGVINMTVITVVLPITRDLPTGSDMLLTYALWGIVYEYAATPLLWLTTIGGAAIFGWLTLPVAWRIRSMDSDSALEGLP